MEHLTALNQYLQRLRNLEYIDVFIVSALEKFFKKYYNHLQISHYTDLFQLTFYSWKKKINFKK